MHVSSFFRVGHLKRHSRSLVRCECFSLESTSRMRHLDAKITDGKSRGHLQLADISNKPNCLPKDKAGGLCLETPLLDKQTGQESPATGVTAIVTVIKVHKPSSSCQGPRGTLTRKSDWHQSVAVLKRCSMVFTRFEKQKQMKGSQEVPAKITFLRPEFEGSVLANTNR